MRTSVQTQAGFSMVELMISLVISLVLMLGAVLAFQNSRSSFKTVDAQSRLQEDARFVIDLLDADVRMANFWGLNSRADYITNRGELGPGVLAGFTATQKSWIDLCGGVDSGWAILAESYVDGNNNAYGLACDPLVDAQPGSDVLVVRRAGGERARPAADGGPVLDTDRLYLQTSRIQGEFFVPACDDPNDVACIPADYQPPLSRSHPLEVHIYYVAESSDRGDAPALRRKRLANINGASEGAAWVDEEMISGVEDLQVEIGVDTNNDGSVDVQVNPGAVPANGRIINVTVWARVRALEADQKYTDGREYQYADIDAVQFNDSFQRMVVSKTIYLRNTRK